MILSNYNERREGGKCGRLDSQNIRMQSLNNWVKSALIMRHISTWHARDSLCCGKGGDLNKWAKGKLYNYIACETPPVSF